MENSENQPSALANDIPTILKKLDSEKKSPQFIPGLEVRQEALRTFMIKVGKRYEDCCFDNFICSLNKQTEVVKAFKEYSKNALQEIESGRGIILFGPSGTGKDHLLISLAREIILKFGTDFIYPPAWDGIAFRIGWINGMDLFGKIRDAIDKKIEEADLLGTYNHYDILILSDPIPPRGNLTDFQTAMLFRILDDRYRNCKPTWVSLNVIGSKEADERMGPQLVDRLKDGALCIHCDWPSYRKTYKNI